MQTFRAALGTYCAGQASVGGPLLPFRAWLALSASKHLILASFCQQ